MMKRLCINIDHIATLREARAALEPDPVHAVPILENAGASGVVVHLREDRRHINDRDLRLLREVIKTKLDLEMAATAEMKSIALEVLPELVTLVPEKRMELTTEGGLDLRLTQATLSEYIPPLQDADIEVSLFIDPDPEQVALAAGLGADYIEIHTGEFANARTREARVYQIERIRAAAKQAHQLGLRVNAGHGLNYDNVVDMLAIHEIGEMSIGHSIIARSVFVGLDQAVRDMVALFRLFPAPDGLH